MKTVPVPGPNSERRDWFEPVLTSLDRSVHIHVTAWYMRVCGGVQGSMWASTYLASSIILLYKVESCKGKVDTTLDWYFGTDDKKTTILLSIISDR